MMENFESFFVIILFAGVYLCGVYAEGNVSRRIWIWDMAFNFRTFKISGLLGYYFFLL